MNPATLDEARAAKGRAMEVFGKLAEVVGVGVTRVGEGYGVKVNLRKEPRGVRLPDAVEGVPVCVEVVGPLRTR
jgi:hypothetical protein